MRHAFGRDQKEATAKVLRRLEEEFTTGVSAKIWKSGIPALSVEECWEIAPLQLFSTPNRGSMFYDDRD